VSHTSRSTSKTVELQSASSAIKCEAAAARSLPIAALPDRIKFGSTVNQVRRRVGTMKWLRQLILLVAAFAQFCTSQGQGTFVNLGFEQANLPYLAPGQSGGDVSALDALPGWTVQMNLGNILYNNQNLDLASVSILNTNYPGPPGFALGTYYVLLQAGGYPGEPATIPSIAQNGEVPATAKSMRLIAYSSPPVVTFAGNQIPLFALNTVGYRTFYGADISAYAGQTGELKFTGGLTYFDNISFSTLGIPEPAPLAMITTGLVLLFAFQHGRGSRL